MDVFPGLSFYASDKAKGLGYLLKLMLPVAIVSNMLYIMSAVTGIAFMPDIGISEQNLPGGLKSISCLRRNFLWRDFSFLGFIYLLDDKKIPVIPAFSGILFIIPHILAFGRSAWIYFALIHIIIA